MECVTPPSLWLSRDAQSDMALNLNLNVPQGDEAPAIALWNLWCA
jgi:hypothetical protein